MTDQFAPIQHPHDPNSHDDGMKRKTTTALTVGLLVISVICLVVAGIFFGEATAKQSNAKLFYAQSHSANSNQSSAKCDDGVVKRINADNDPCASFYSKGKFAYSLIVSPDKVYVINDTPFGSSEHISIRSQIESMDKSYRNKTIALEPTGGYVIGSMEVTIYNAW